MKIKSGGFTLIELLAGAILVVLAFSAQTVQAQARHALSSSLGVVPRFAHVGDTITATCTVYNLLSTEQYGDDWIITNCTMTFFPSGNPPLGCSQTNFTVPIPGASNVTINPCGPNFTVFGRVLPTGSSLDISATFTVPNCDGKYTLLEMSSLAVGIDTFDHSTPNCPYGGGQSYESADEITVLLPPCISCTKTCTTGTGYVSFSGSVSNCGSSVLTNVTVIDNQPVANTVVTNFGTNILNPSATFGFSGSYPADQSVTNIDTITVSGMELYLGQLSVITVSSSFSSTCSASTSLFGPRADASNFVLSFATATGRTYTVEFTTSLSPTDWQPLTNLPGDGAVATVRDGITNSQRFYRVLTQ